MQVITLVPKITVIKLKVNHPMVHQEIAEMDGEQEKNNFHMDVVSDMPGWWRNNTLKCCLDEGIIHFSGFK